VDARSSWTMCVIQPYKEHIYIYIYSEWWHVDTNAQNNNNNENKISHA
jgi:hypothetical protein